MNAERRKAITDAIAKAVRARDLLSDARDAIEQAKDDEQEYYDNMPEPIQRGAKGETAEAVIGELDTLFDEIGQAIDVIDGMTEPTL